MARRRAFLSVCLKAFEESLLIKTYDICLNFFDPTASATAYGQRPKFVRAKHSATAEGENCAYGPTLGLPQEQDQGGQTHESICCTSSTT